MPIKKQHVFRFELLNLLLWRLEVENNIAKITLYSQHFCNNQIFNL
jgi:hypothetical protein